MVADGRGTATPAGPARKQLAPVRTKCQLGLFVLGNFSSSGICCYGYIAADDFVIPGKGMHQITAVYAAGVVVYGQLTNKWTVTFYDGLSTTRKPESLPS